MGRSVTNFVSSSYLKKSFLDPMGGGLSGGSSRKRNIREEAATVQQDPFNNGEKKISAGKRASSPIQKNLA